MSRLRSFAGDAGFYWAGAAISVHQYDHVRSYVCGVLMVIAAAYCMVHDLRNGGPPPC
jgi:hypothetical protein